MSEDHFELQSVVGRWCERSIDDMEHAALVYITKEVHNHFGDNGLVALLADYVRMGREYGDMMNTDSRNMRERIAELEKQVDDLRGELAQSDKASLLTRIEVLKKQLSEKISEETSDGYHTFKELYHHRAVLFAALCKCYPDKTWKSRKHHDGSMFEGMFICGIDTAGGQATYHYDIDPYWNMFLVKELENAPEWDGHTSAEAIERIAQIEPSNIAELVRVLQGIHGIINESSGVAGYHLNGDIATWEELGYPDEIDDVLKNTKEAAK